MIKAFWFNNRQTGPEILQPKFFTPKTQIQIYAELADVKLPISVEVSAFFNGAPVFQKSYKIEEVSGKKDYWHHVFMTSGALELRDFVETLENDPDRMDISIRYGDKTCAQSISCEYAIISGKTTDFDGKPFPAAVIYYYLSFDGRAGGMGAWSDKEGNYTIKLPKMEYNAVFIDDKSYFWTSLEAWAWKMIVDRDEVHDYKIGNGEVYSLDAWANNGGSQSLFIFFRPMVLPYARREMLSPLKLIKRQIKRVEISGKKYKLFKASPDIDIKDITVELNGTKTNNISLQKIAETRTSGNIMYAYILQVERIPGYNISKQTLVLEYNFKDSKGKKVQAQGRTQFHYTNAYGLAVR